MNESFSKEMHKLFQIRRRIVLFEELSCSYRSTKWQWCDIEDLAVTWARDRETYRQRERETDRQRKKEREREISSCKNKEYKKAKEIERQRQRDRETDRDRLREKWWNTLRIVKGVIHVFWDIVTLAEYIRMNTVTEISKIY